MEEDPDDLKDVPEMDIITIVLDNEARSPRIDLGNVPPHLAIIVMQKAIEALDMLLPGPTIVYDDQVVYSESFFSEDDLE